MRHSKPLGLTEMRRAQGVASLSSVIRSCRCPRRRQRFHRLGAHGLSAYTPIAASYLLDGHKRPVVQILALL